MACIELKNVRKRWVGATAVEGIDLKIDDGAFVAVLGPSGCGKTTTLLMLAGIYSPSAGDIAFDGARVNDVEARDRNVGIVFQSYALYPNMTVLQNIMFPLRFKKVERAEAEHRAREIAGLVRIDAFVDRRQASSRAASSNALRWREHRQATASAPARRAIVESRRVAPTIDAHRDPAHPARAWCATILVTHDQIGRRRWPTTLSS
jgi:ABC-type branched-subunit amino acid transport system ATPase component